MSRLYNILKVQSSNLSSFLGCQIYGASSSIASLVTINTLAAISVDRYIVVVRRHSSMQRLAKSTTGNVAVVVAVKA